MNNIKTTSFGKNPWPGFQPRPLLKCFQKNCAYCLAGTIISFILASILFFGWPACLTHSLNFPILHSSGDGGLTSSWVQRIIEGWLWNNQRCGYPFGSAFYDFPGSDSGNLFILKILSFLNIEYFQIINIYILANISFAFCVSFIVLLSFGLDKNFAFALACLFAFIPFYFLRLGHLFYVSYFVVPVYFYYAFKISYFCSLENKIKIKHFETFLAILCLLLLSCFGIYYALFGMIVIGVSGLVGSLKYSSLKPSFTAILAIFVITTGVFLNLAPSILYSLKNGKNTEAAVRGTGESEIYGFKLAQLVLPRSDHRIPQLASITEKYCKSAPLINENSTSTLGFFSTIGLILAGFVLAANASGRFVNPETSLLSVISLVLFLCGTVGGLGALFALTITPSIRGWNRISPFLAFSCLAILGLSIQIFFYRFAPQKIFKSLCFITSIFILLVGLYDQTIPAKSAQIDYNKNQFETDRAFVQLIEQNLEPYSPVFQFPYMPFPEHGNIHNLHDYALFSGFLYSKTLCWSYGGMKGRVGDLFYRELSKKPIAAQLTYIKKLGFKAIYVDRRGYLDNAEALEKDLTELIPYSKRLEKNDKSAFLITLPDAESPTFVNLTPNEIIAKTGWGVLQAGITYTHSLNEFRFKNWSLGEENHRWSLGKHCSIEFFIDSIDAFNGELILEGFSYSNQEIDVFINNTIIKKCDMDGTKAITSIKIPKKLLVNGNNELAFYIPGSQKPSNGDLREVGYALVSLSIK